MGNENKALDILVNKIMSACESRIKKYKADHTFKTTIWKVNDDGTYQINYLGQTYNVPSAVGSLKLGQQVWLKIPNGIFREMHIYGTPETTSSGGGESSHTHSNLSVLETITLALINKWNEAFEKSHIHTNKESLDTITPEKIEYWDNKSEFDGDYNSLTNKPTIPSIDGLASEDYVDDKISNTYTKNEVDNKFSTLESNIDWKESVSTFNDIATVYPFPVDGWTVNVMDTDYTYRYNGNKWIAISANAIPKATDDVDGLLSKEDHAKYEESYVHSQSAHAPSNAEVNQNAFSNVKVNSTTISADTKTDTLTLVGNNITLTPDATNDKVTIGINKDNVIDALEYTPQSVKHCRVGQSNSSTSNSWYRFASIICTESYGDRSITFKVSSGYNEFSEYVGILTAHFRTGGSKTWQSGELIWEYAGNKVVPSDFVVAYKNTENTSCEVELWVKISKVYYYRYFEVLSEHTRIDFDNSWILYDITTSAGSSESITSGFTLVESKLLSLNNNVATATKLATARNINGMSVDGSANRTNYGICPTTAATVAKTVDCTGFELITGAEITVKFTITNTASSPTLNVNNTGAKAIYYRGSAISAGYLVANRTYSFRYNGNQWDLVGDINTDTNNKVTQTNTTTNADYRVALSANANNTTETNTLHKSVNFTANPNTGAFFAKGYDRIDITGQTLDIDTLTLSSGSPEIMRYVEKTDRGSDNITNIPFTGKAFILDVELIRWASTSDYITKQTFVSVGAKDNEYVRYCTSGTWSTWTKRVFTDNNTKNTAGSTDTSSKIFLVGATSQDTNPQTYSHDTAYVGTNGHLYSNSKQVVNLSDSQALTNKTYNGYTLGTACAKGVDTTVTSGSTNLVTSDAVYKILEWKFLYSKVGIGSTTIPSNAREIIIKINVNSQDIVLHLDFSTGELDDSIQSYRVGYYQTSEIGCGAVFDVNTSSITLVGAFLNNKVVTSNTEWAVRYR